jgi:GNAT superfamily N-acetyltransferase
MDSSVRARPAEPSDYDHFTRLVVELATGDPIPPRERWEAAIAPTMLLFEQGGEVVAYTYYQVLADTGYVRHVVVDPAHRGRRLGRVVMDELAAIFRKAGCSRWALNVKPDNAPAIALYRSVGMLPAYESTAVRLRWDAVATLPAPSREVAARPLDPADDAALEDAFDMPRGSLAAARKIPDRFLYRLVDPSAPSEARVGVASFDRHFPGAFPFRVAEPGFARPLLEALRPHALPQHEHLGLVIEDDAPLTSLLLAAGATPQLAIVHYRGDL